VLARVFLGASFNDVSRRVVGHPSSSEWAIAPPCFAEGDVINVKAPMLPSGTEIERSSINGALSLYRTVAVKPIYNQHRYGSVT
jgi:hypothetical protein